jgi:hypothetical protein
MPRPSFADVTDTLLTIADGTSFTAGEAHEHGISRRRLARAATAGHLHRVARGHYSLDEDPLNTARHHVDRLRGRGVDAVVGGLSAADAWGIPVFGSDGPVTERPLTLLVPRGAQVRRGTRHGVRLREAALIPSDIVSLSDVPITRPLRTGVDVARDFGRCRASALIPLSAGMRAQVTWALSPEGTVSAHDVTARIQSSIELRRALLADLDDVVARVNAYGMGWVHRVIADAEPLLETALEGVAWSVITGADLPRPRPQVWVSGRSGRRYRVDFLFGDRVILEADGGVKYADRTPWEEKQRQSDLEAAGFWVVRCAWDELLHRPLDVVARIALALNRSAL